MTRISEGGLILRTSAAAVLTRTQPTRIPPVPAEAAERAQQADLRDGPPQAPPWRWEGLLRGTCPAPPAHLRLLAAQGVTGRTGTALLYARALRAQP